MDGVVVELIDRGRPLTGSGASLRLTTVARTLFDTDVVSKWDLRRGSRMLVVARPREGLGRNHCLRRR